VRVLHIAPTYFADHSVVGGAERYTRELARAMSAVADVVLLSFGERAATVTDGSLRIELLRRPRLHGGGSLATNPVSRRFVRLVQWADVVHCHQVNTLSTDLGILFGRAFGKRVFVTDLGGGHRWALSKLFPILRRADALLLISAYSRALWARRKLWSRPAALHVIGGGVDAERFAPGEGPKSGETLFVGRLLPHKGVNYLIEAMPRGAPLRLVGRPYDGVFFSQLRAAAAGRSVVFETTASDDDLIERYRRALVTVLPSVYESIDGAWTQQPELLGLVVLESMACGTPVIVTRVASLPELVQDGVTGFIVAPNDPDAIREKIQWLRDHPASAVEMGRRARALVVEHFTWSAVVARCLQAYSACGVRESPRQ
jgi:glycosyltransferase involved in cell wall biosynthesis